MSARPSAAQPPPETGAAGPLGEVEGGASSTNLAEPVTPGEAGGLSGEADAAVSFLERWRPGGPWVLTSIVPDGRTTTRTFESVGPMRSWIHTRQGRENLYFSVNDLREGVSKKATKEDVAALRGLHVDVDPRAGEDLEQERGRILDRLRKFEPAPTVVMDSGGGYQAFWRLQEPIPTGGPLGRAAELEAYSLQLALRLGADPCHNIDRIMRLPGTINVPNKKKRDRGRVRALAAVVDERWELVYPLERFTPAQPVQSPSTAAGREVALSGNLPRVTSLDELPDGVSDRIKALIVNGRDEDDPDRYPSRSEAVFAVLCALARAGTPDDVMASIILDPDFGISAHVREQPRAQQYAAQQIKRARLEADDSFDCDKDGRPYATSQRNIRLAMRKMGVVVSHDLFAGRSRVDGLEGFGPALDDAAANRLWLEIDERFKFRPSKDLFQTVVADAARLNGFHPVTEYLAGLKWDGEGRIDRWLSTYGGAADTPYTRAVGKIVLVAAVRRVRQPGVKFDEMLVLESPQGTNKSSALKVLAVHDDWFTDDLPLNAEARRVIEALSGKWVVEAGELKGMRQGGANHLKGLLSRTHDKARMAYDRLEREVPRQCVIVGTTNDSRYLRDTTGNRRFWPVEVTGFDLEALRRDRDQLWAEAAAREAEGASIRLDPSLWDAAAEEQDARRVEDPFYETLLSALGEEAPGKLRASDAWSILGKPSGMRTQDDNERLGDAMRRLGFERGRRRFGAGPEIAYIRGDGTRQFEVNLGSGGEPPF